MSTRRKDVTREVTGEGRAHPYVIFDLILIVMWTVGLIGAHLVAWEILRLIGCLGVLSYWLIDGEAIDQGIRGTRFREPDRIPGHLLRWED